MNVCRSNVQLSGSRRRLGFGSKITWHLIDIFLWALERVRIPIIPNLAENLYADSSSSGLPFVSSTTTHDEEIARDGAEAKSTASGGDS